MTDVKVGFGRIRVEVLVGFGMGETRSHGA
jgi:hypothetical protein